MNNIDNFIFDEIQEISSYYKERIALIFYPYLEIGITRHFREWRKHISAENYVFEQNVLRYTFIKLLQGS